MPSDPPQPADGAPARAWTGREVLRVPSPAFSLTPPELHNPDSVPPAARALMTDVWFKRDFPASDVVFTLIEGAVVAGDGLAFTDASALIPASATDHRPDEIADARDAIGRARARAALPERKGTWVLCKKNGKDNYGHWLMEMFPKASLALEHLADSDLRFVVPATGERLAAVIAACMRALGVPPERVFAADASPVRFERLIVVEGLTRHGSFMSPLVVASVRRLADGIVPGPRERIYVTRESARRRDFADPAAVLARAEASGHMPFDPGSADLWTQIGMFAGARRIVGVMGAALTNIVFARPDAEVVVLAPARMPDTFFWFIAALRGFRYIEVRCQPAGDDPARSDPNDVSWFHQALLFPNDLAETVFPTIPARHQNGHVYRRVALADLRRLGVAEATPYLPAANLSVPPLLFGDGATVPAREGDSAGANLPLGSLDAYILHDVVVHGRWGVIVCGDVVLGETTGHLPVHMMAGVEWLEDGRLRWPDYSVGLHLPAAYHLLTGNQDNYFHWLIDLLCRFDAAEFRGFGVLPPVAEELCLLRPPLDAAWKQESFDLLVPPGLKQAVVTGDAAVHVERLVYIPDLAGGGFGPHRRLLAVFDRMRAAAYEALGAAPVAPWRKLFVSRADSANRVLVNEAELAALAAEAGFRTIVLGGMSVADQIRLFAEATHIVAPHGAGLTNLAFCRPGTRVCELQMDIYLHVAFRHLAALRGLQYGCVVGAHTPPRQDWVHHNTYRVEPAAFAAVLADPRFVGG